MKEEEQSEAEMLRGILEDIAELIQQTRESRGELRQVEQELKQELDKKKITQFAYDIRSEQIRRSHQDIDYNLRSLDRQRKIFLQKLRELE